MDEQTKMLDGLPYETRIKVVKEHLLSSIRKSRLDEAFPEFLSLAEKFPVISYADYIRTVQELRSCLDDAFRWAGLATPRKPFSRPKKMGPGKKRR